MLLEPPYRYLLIMAVTGSILSLLGFLGYRTRPDTKGWRRVVPSPMHWTGLCLGSGMVLLFLYIRLFVGSARSDAQNQMTILTGLIVAFAIGVAICGWTVVRIRRMALEWRGDAFAYSKPGGVRLTRSMNELTEVRASMLGWLILNFEDGEVLKLDSNARGSEEFVRSIIERRRDLFPNAP